MAQTTANLVGSVLSRPNLDTPEAIMTHEEEIGDRNLEESYEEQGQNLTQTAQGTQNSKKGWKNKATRIHRVVEQIDDEPVGIVVFKWLLILIGSMMLGVVLFLTGEVIYDWSTGELKQQQDKALANVQNQNHTTSTEANQ